MPSKRILSPDEAEALFNEAEPTKGRPRVRAYDPATQERVIPGRLHTFDIINERFARHFRVSLFNLIRRSADISVGGVTIEKYSDFIEGLATPANLNLVSMQPLRGNALVVFPPALIYLVVDSLFGGDGRFLDGGGRSEFTHTEQRIIQRLLRLALASYSKGWESIYRIEPEYQRAETQVKFANITNAGNELVVNTRFHVEVGAFGSDFQICMPYSMLEPIRELLSGPLKKKDPEEENARKRQLAAQVEQSHVCLTADFLRVAQTLGDLVRLQVGDVLPIELPDEIEAQVDNVPVFNCKYGRIEDRTALRVTQVIDHVAQAAYRNHKS